MRVSARARVRGRGGQQQQHSGQLRQKLRAPSPAGKCASPEPGGESAAGGGPRALCYCANGLHIPGARRPPDKRLNGGDVTVMQAPAHSRPEQGAESAEREASPAQVPGRGRPCAPTPARAPPPRARAAPGSAPSAEPLSPRPRSRPRPAWGWRWPSQVRAAASRPALPSAARKSPVGPAGRAPGQEPQGGGRRANSARARKLCKPEWAGDPAGWGWGSPALSSTPQSGPPRVGRPPLRCRWMGRPV